MNTGTDIHKSTQKIQVTTRLSSHSTESKQQNYMTVEGNIPTLATFYTVQSSYSFWYCCLGLFIVYPMVTKAAVVLYRRRNMGGMGTIVELLPIVG
jgi:hypothetical protein